MLKIVLFISLFTNLFAKEFKVFKGTFEEHIWPEDEHFENKQQWIFKFHDENNQVYFFNFEGQSDSFKKFGFFAQKMNLNIEFAAFFEDQLIGKVAYFNNNLSLPEYIKNDLFSPIQSDEQVSSSFYETLFTKEGNPFIVKKSKLNKRNPLDFPLRKVGKNIITVHGEILPLVETGIVDEIYYIIDKTTENKRLYYLDMKDFPPHLYEYLINMSSISEPVTLDVLAIKNQGQAEYESYDVQKIVTYQYKLSELKELQGRVYFFPESTIFKTIGDIPRTYSINVTLRNSSKAYFHGKEITVRGRTLELAGESKLFLEKIVTKRPTKFIATGVLRFERKNENYEQDRFDNIRFDPVLNQIIISQPTPFVYYLDLPNGHHYPLFTFNKGLKFLVGKNITMEVYSLEDQVIPLKILKINGKNSEIKTNPFKEISLEGQYIHTRNELPEIKLTIDKSGNWSYIGDDHFPHFFSYASTITGNKIQQIHSIDGTTFVLETQLDSDYNYYDGPVIQLPFTYPHTCENTLLGPTGLKLIELNSK